MNIPCPSCGKTLEVAEDFAGRRVKCPDCREVFKVASSTAVAVTPAAKLAQTEVSERLLPAKKSATPGDDEEGCCYIHIRKDEVYLTQEIEKRMENLIETEQLDMRIMDVEDEPPDELRPNDLVISGKVTECDYGSQFMRYFFTFVTIFGPGSCQLKVDAEVETAGGENRRIKSRARIGIGFFGGTGTGLMKRNVQTVAGHIAGGAARHATGTSFLNAQAYSCAYWSLGLGLASLIPFLGIVLGPISFVVSVVALVPISRRGLPRGKGAAIAGAVLSFLGCAISAGLIVFGLIK